MARRVQELIADPDHPLNDAADLVTRNISEDPRAGHRGLESGHFYILSASEAWDSLAMWRLYGGVQESYAIGLDSTQPLSILASRSGRTTASGLCISRQTWRPVRYTEEEQAELTDSVLDALPGRMAALREALADGDSDADFSDFSTLPDTIRGEAEALLDDIQQALLLIKHPGFIDERETTASFWPPAPTVTKPARWRRDCCVTAPRPTGSRRTSG